MRTAQRSRPQLAEQRPEPGRFWVRHVPRGWPAPRRAWVHLARAGLGVARTGRRVPALDASVAVDDLLYLPPVAREYRAHRDALLHAHLARGAPVLVQTVLPELPPSSIAPGATLVLDPLAQLLEAPAEPLDPGGSAAAGTVLVWPLIAGITDGEELWERALAPLAAAGIECIVPLALQLSPAERRCLADGVDEDAYHALFHRPPPSERPFARYVHRRFGASPFLARPLPRAPRVAADNRRISGLLAHAADLEQRLGRPASGVHALYRAARWVDAAEHDVAALAREGNLGVVEPLDRTSRELIEEWVEDGVSRRVAALEKEYLEEDEA